MIKTNKGKIRAKGTISELLADIGVAAHAVYFESLLPNFPEDKAKEMIRDAVEVAILTDEERAEHMKNSLFEALRNVFGVDEDEEEPEEESEGEEE